MDPETSTGKSLIGDGCCAICGTKDALLFAFACNCKRGHLDRQFNAVPLDEKGHYAVEGVVFAAGKCWACFQKPFPKDELEWCQW